ncbi:HEAT repeat domain-containing protein [Halapricum hydrolyticum]|uniref:HEAT repeat domain-containing protein n=1 Tax=Halapricum hydrolyticum TaxID=2979991 RepID=A0AAE3LGC4_9EURY|nr:HEAT repeat domain-containing protein [Halapricum hydrolyticum]MCU4716951.1 HEAT repeat domain-containing protein [Halapricum hydrolyticum]MCU4725444.1 HEAT repeat domain-containing protein [Halapricum hydrolyticum]
MTDPDDFQPDATSESGFDSDDLADPELGASESEHPEADGPPDPQLDPAKSPGFDAEIESLADIEVGRDDVTIGTATPAELTVADTTPVADDGHAELLETLETGPAPKRRRAALALAEREPIDAVVDALATRVHEDPDPDVRQFAVEALGDLGADVASTVAREALDDPNPWVRAEAVVVLDGRDRRAHADAIEARLEDEHHAVRRNALLSLSKHSGADLLETLLAFEDDDSERVREWVAELLGDFDDERARAALDRLRDDDSDIVAEAATHALDSDSDRRELFTRSTVPTDQPRHDVPPDL